MDTVTDQSHEPTDGRIARRTFLSGFALASLSPVWDESTSGPGSVGTTNGQAVDTTFEFGASVDGWQGRAPDAIDGETNPTLDLELGQRYRVRLENTDGVQHNFTLLDADGNSITSTETTSDEGETATLTFTATRELDQYYCGIHTDLMRGDVQVEAATEVEASPTPDAEEVEVRYELGAVIGGWQGRLPEERDHENRIAEQQNPTLSFEAGTRYMVVWENADGVPHNFTIQNEGESDILATETIANQGEMRSITFTATSEMSQYVCTIHPGTMRGDIDVSGGGIGEILSEAGGILGGVVALAAVVVGGLGYTLARYFGDSDEP